MYVNKCIFFRQVGVALWLEPCRRFAVSELLATVFSLGAWSRWAVLDCPFLLPPVFLTPYPVKLTGGTSSTSYHSLLTRAVSVSSLACQKSQHSFPFFYCISDLSIRFYLREPSAPSPSLAVPECKLWHWYIHLQHWHQPTKQHYCLVVSLRCILYPFL